MWLPKLVSVFYPFLASDWTDQSDAVRGGVSFSKLDIINHGKAAVFSGNLNTTILNAGFSAQRTTGGTRKYDWSKYKGVQFEYQTPDCSLVDKTFTLIIKDRLQQGDDGPPESGVPRDPTLPPGVDTIDFEYHWKPECSKHNKRKTYVVRPKFKDFGPEYRGEKTTGELDLKTVRRFTMMVRSFDQTRRQDGDYLMVVKGIKLWK